MKKIGFLILFALLIFILPFNIKALTKQQQENILTFAKEMIEKGNNEHRDNNGFSLLAYLSGPERLSGWQGKLRNLKNIYYLKYTENGKTKYVNGNRWVFNCDSFVSYVLWHTYGIKVVKSDGEPWTVSTYNRNASNNKIMGFTNTKYRKLVNLDLNELQPGDLILCYKSGDPTHIMLYLGNGLIAHASTKHLNSSYILSKKDLGLQIAMLKERYANSDYSYRIIRIKDTAPTKELNMQITWPDTMKNEVLGIKKIDNYPIIDITYSNLPSKEITATFTFKDDNGLKGYYFSEKNATPTNFLTINNLRQYNVTQKITKNGIYYLYVIDNNNQMSKKQINIQNIDLQLPIIDNITSIVNNQTYNIIIYATDTSKLTYSIDGLHYQPNNFFKDLVAGKYVIHVRDEAFNVTTRELVLQNINIQEKLPVITNIQYKYNTNDKFDITVTADSGLNDQNNKLLYSLDGTNYQASNIFRNISKKNCTLHVKNQNNKITTQNINLNEDNLPKINLVYLEKYSQEINLKIELINQNDKLYYNVTNNDNVPNKWFNYNNKIQYTIKENGTYYIWVKNSQNITLYKKIKINHIDQEKPNIYNVQIIKNSNKTYDLEVKASDFGCNNLSYSIDGRNYQPNNIFNNINKYNDYKIYVNDGCNNIAIYEYKNNNNNNSENNFVMLTILIICIILAIIGTVIIFLYKKKRLKKHE